MIDWGGKVAAWFAGVTAAAATLAGLVYGTTKHLHGIMLAAFIVLVVIAALAFLGLLFTGVRVVWAAWRRRSRRPTTPAADQPEERSPTVPSGPAVTDRWQPTITDVSSEMLQLQNNSMNHPGYMTRSPMAGPPPSVRVGLSIACSELQATASTSDLRAKFLRFLGQPAVMDLVRQLTHINPEATWKARDDNPPFNFGAVLAPPGQEEQAPVGWARILLPESLTRRYGRDARSAYLVLYVEPRTADGRPAPLASLASWHQRLSMALQLPGAVAGFLADDLGLATAADPAAQIGVWLKTPHHLTELVEVDAFDSVPGSAQSNWFMGFAVSSRQGEPVSDVALAWLRQLCDSALHLDDYESALASLRPRSGSGRPRLEVHISQGPEWDTWERLAYIVALEVTVMNMTDSRIRLASIGLGSGWDEPPPGELPVLSAEQLSALDAEVRARRNHRYQPQLQALQYVPAEDSVTGWVVTTATRPPLGGTPRLTLLIGEAVGTRYQVVIPRTDPQTVNQPIDEP